MDYIECITDFIGNDRSYVYVHYYIKEDGEKHVFYVGKGKSNRAIHTKRNTLHQQYVDKLKSKGIDYKIEIVEIFDDEFKCYEKEKELQRYYESINQAECSINGYPDVVKHESLKYRNSNNEMFRTMRECAERVGGSSSQICKAIQEGFPYRGLYWYKIEV